MVQFDKLPPVVIRVANRMRGLDEATVQRLAESIQKIGLQTPISVRWCAEENPDYSADLIAGNHRLEACKRLGMEFVPVAVHDGSDGDARLWEIAENLHRAELTPLEWSEHVAEWVRLSMKVGHFVPPGGQQPNDQGIRKAARELPVPGKTEEAKRKQVERAVKIAGLPDDVKEQAREEEWSQTRLLQAASPPREIVEARTKPAPAIKNAFESEEDWKRALFTVWNRGAQDWRERALAAMDQPVFDNTRAA